jgi:hypothetical protein
MTVYSERKSEAPVKDNKDQEELETTPDRQGQQHQLQPPGRQQAAESERVVTHTLEQAKRSRISKKGWVTRVTNELLEDLGRQQIDRDGLLSLVSDLEGQLRGLGEVQDLVTSLLPTEEIEADILDQTGVAEIGRRAIREAQRVVRGDALQVRVASGSGEALQQLQDRDPSERPVVSGPAELRVGSSPLASAASGSVVSASRASESATSGSVGRLRLPKIEIPTFAGDVNDWPGWVETFDSTIGAADGLSESERRIYLMSYLRGDALRAVKGVSRTGSGYQEARKILRETYGRPKVIRDNLYRRMRDLPCVRSEQDCAAMRKFIDEATAVMAGLRELGVETVQLGGWFTTAIEPKLPNSYRQEWARSQGEDDGSVEKLLTFLRSELRVHERVFQIGKEKQGSSGWQAESKHHPAAAALQSQNLAPPCCTLCGGAHRPMNCKAELSYEAVQAKLKGSKVCFRCAEEGHFRAKCRVKVKCRKCDRSHLTGAHREQRGGESWAGAKQGAGWSAPAARQQQPTGDRGSTAEVRTAAVNGAVVSVLKTVCAVAAGGGRQQLPLRALLDTGCSHTMFAGNMARTLGLKVVGHRQLSIAAFGGVVYKGRYPIVEGVLLGSSGCRFPFQAVAVDHLPAPMRAVPARMVQEFQLQCPGQVADVGSEAPVSMLIGDDLYDDVVTGPCVRLPSGGKATPTLFGWVLHGSAEEEDSFAGIAHAYRAVELSEFYELEHIGVREAEENDGELIAQLEESIRRDVDGRVEVRLPWKPGGRDKLTENKGVAVARLASMWRRLQDDEKDSYVAASEEFFSNGWAEPVPSRQDGDRVVSYLPHKGVRKASDTTAVRMVHDGSAKEKGGRALNECLESGPSLLPCLFGMLVRFRLGKVAVCGDVAKAFLQIRIAEEDRDACRFLVYRADGSLQEARMTSALFGSTASPFILQTVLRWLLGKSGLGHLVDSVYVDDLIESVDSVEAAIQVWSEAVQALKQACFHLRKLKSNSEEMKERFKGDLETGDAETKVLGVWWDSLEDCILPMRPLKLAKAEEGPMSKRGVAAALARIYDPLGLAAPAVTPLKIFLQDLWMRDRRWDAPLSSEEQEAFRLIVRNLEYQEAVSGVRIPRWVGIATGTRTTLHVFTDASQRVYAAVAYLRVESDGGVETNIIAARSRVGPTKQLSVPRMELMGVLVGSRLAKTLIAETSKRLTLEGVVMWTDSATVWHWLREATVQSKVFVSNRITEVKENLPGAEFRWLPGKVNPADLPTRGMSSQDLTQERRWFRGPDFLVLERQQWPVLPPAGETAVDLQEDTQAASWPAVLAVGCAGSSLGAARGDTADLQDRAEGTSSKGRHQGHATLGRGRRPHPNGRANAVGITVHGGGEASSGSSAVWSGGATDSARPREMSTCRHRLRNR